MTLIPGELRTLTTLCDALLPAPTCCALDAAGHCLRLLARGSVTLCVPSNSAAGATVLAFAALYVLEHVRYPSDFR